MPPSFSTMDGAADSKHGMGAAIGVLVVVVFVAVMSCLFSRMCTNRPPLNHPVRDSLPERHPETIPDVEGGRPDAVGKRNGLKKPVRPKLAKLHEGDSGSDSTRSSCSICLGDYKDSDVRRSLPGCHHVFHSKCVDQWLQMHPTCPVCRSSPNPTPLAKAHQASTAPRDQLNR